MNAEKADEGDGINKKQTNTHSITKQYEGGSKYSSKRPETELAGLAAASQDEI